MEKMIEFKGTKKGIIIQMEDYTDFNLVLKEIDKKLNEQKDFFKGVKIIGVDGKFLTEKDRYNLYELIHVKYELEIESLDSIQKAEKPEEKKEIIKEVIVEKIIEKHSDEETAKIIRRNIRSGMKIESEGHIIVIGDVNPGAELQAGGNVIVLGRLKGMVQAGKYNDKNAFVIASKLMPTQIRIADVIARPPEDDIDVFKPEIAFLKDGKMNIEEL